jgi:hypothetical protein
LTVGELSKESSEEMTLSFIQRIVNFDTNQMIKLIRETMKKDFLSRPSYNFETVQCASKACGFLVKWVIAQVHFSKILDKVEPLRNKVPSLEEQAETTKQQAGQIITMISELEAKIDKCTRRSRRFSLARPKRSKGRWSVSKAR